MVDFASLEKETVDIWDRNADFWDERMGEGNEFHKFLIEPTQLKLLSLSARERVLDIGCGNGQFARKMASLGCEVVAVDAAPRMIENARQRTPADAEYGWNGYAMAWLMQATRRRCSRLAKESSMRRYVLWR